MAEETLSLEESLLLPLRPGCAGLVTRFPWRNLRGLLRSCSEACWGWPQRLAEVDLRGLLRSTSEACWGRPQQASEVSRRHMDHYHHHWQQSSRQQFYVRRMIMCHHVIVTYFINIVYLHTIGIERQKLWWQILLIGEFVLWPSVKSWQSIFH